MNIKVDSIYTFGKLKNVSAFTSCKKKQNLISKPIRNIGFANAAYFAGKIAVENSKNQRMSKLTDSQFDTLLEQNNYKLTENGKYQKIYSDDERLKICTSRESNESHKSILIQQPISKDEMKGFKEFLELGNGKALKYKDKYFDNLMVGYLNLKRGAIFEKHKSLAENNDYYQDLVIAPLISSTDVVYTNYLFNYKSNDFKSVNDYLRALSNKTVSHIPEEINKEINVISQYIDTHKIQKPVKLFRTDSVDAFNNIKTEDGSVFDLGKVMKEVKNCKNPEEIAQKVNWVKEFVQDNKLTANFPGFLSTSLDKNIGSFFDGKCDVDWQLEAKKGTKGVYLETLNVNGCFTRENEFLLQKGSNISINSVDYDFDNKKWKVTGEVSN